MSQFAPEAFSDAEDIAPQAPTWRRVRAGITFVMPGGKTFQSIGFELLDLAPEFPRMEAALTAWRTRTGAQVVDIELEQSEDIAPARDAFGPHRPLH